MKCPNCGIEMLRFSILPRDRYFCRFSSIVSKTKVNDTGFRMYIPCKDQTKCSTCRNLEHTKKQILKCRKLKTQIKESIKECDHYEEGVPKMRARGGKGLLSYRIYSCPSCNLPMVTMMPYTDKIGAYRYIGVCRLAKVAWKKSPFGTSYFPCEIKPPEKSCFTCKKLKETKDLPICRKWGIEIEDLTKQCEYYETKKK